MLLGETCTEEINECNLNAGLCLNGATCYNSWGSYSCVCTHGFEGQHCEINRDDCIDNRCPYHKVCVDGFDEYTCECPPGKYGRYLKICTWVRGDLVKTTTSFYWLICFRSRLRDGGSLRPGQPLHSRELFDASKRKLWVWLSKRIHGKFASNISIMSIILSSISIIKLSFRV